MPSWRQVLRGGRRGLGHASREEIRAQGAQRGAARWAAAALLDAVERAAHAGAALDDAVAGLRQGLRQRQRRLRRRAEVPAGLGDRVPARRAASARWRCRRCARWRAAGSTTRSAAASRATRSTHLDRAPLREDALRQRAAGARLPARLAGRGRARCCGALPRDARLGAARDARPRGRLLLGARRRLRGRRGQVLRVDASTSCATRSATDADAAIAYFGATERGNFEGTNVLEARGPEPPRAACPRSARRCSRPARERVRPGLDDKRLTSWNALMISALADAGAVARARRLPRRRASLRRVRARELRDADGRLLRTYKDGAARLPRLPRGPRLPARGAARRCTRRPSTRAGTRGGRARRHDHRALRRPRARRLLHDRRRPRGARSPGARTSRTRRSRRATRRPRSGCCGWRCSSGEARYEGHALGAAARCCTDRRAPPARLRPPAAGARLLPRAACARWRSSATRERAALAAVGPRAATARTSCSRPARRRPRPTVPLLAATARRSTATPPPTCASTSSARRAGHASPSELARGCHAAVLTSVRAGATTLRSGGRRAATRAPQRTGR